MIQISEQFNQFMFCRKLLHFLRNHCQIINNILFINDKYMWHMDCYHLERRRCICCIDGLKHAYGRSYQ